MKKLLVLIFILVFASAASAVDAWFEVDPSDHQDSYGHSQIITINVVADFAVGSFGMASINASAGAAEDVGTINPEFTYSPDAGDLINSGGVLITGVTGGILTMIGLPPLPAYEIIYSFEFHVPDLPSSSWVLISDSGYTTFLYSGDEVLDMTDLSIHITPEPMTVALLGLGGLFLRRRK